MIADLGRFAAIKDCIIKNDTCCSSLRGRLRRGSLFKTTSVMNLETCMNRMRYSLLLMNSFNKTEAAVFSCRLCFLRAFSFISLLLMHKLPIGLELNAHWKSGVYITMCLFV